MKKIFDGLILIVFGILIGGMIWLVSAPPRGQPVVLRPAPTPAPVLVHVAGAVRSPGVYELPQGARLRDAVKAAGGFSETADPGSLNLAEKVADGDRFAIPEAAPTPIARQETAPESEPERPAQPTETAPAGPVNINTASQTLLETLPGIGPATAEKIIAYREANGPFETIADIVNVSGIGPATYDKIKGSITVGE